MPHVDQIWIGLLTAAHPNSEIDFPGYKRQLLPTDDGEVRFTCTGGSTTIHPMYWAAFSDADPTNPYIVGKISQAKAILDLQNGEYIVLPWLRQAIG